MSKIFDEIKRAESSRQNRTILTKGLRIKGEISGSEDLVVAGVVEGPIRLRGGTVTIEATGNVTADIAAGEIIVYGRVTGKLIARDRIEIKTNAAFAGDVTAARIIVEDGAALEASVDTTNSLSLSQTAGR